MGEDKNTNKWEDDSTSEGKTFTLSLEWVILFCSVFAICFGTIIYFELMSSHTGYDPESTHEELLKEVFKPWYRSAKFWSAFLKELGFAGIIAFLVSVTIERSSKRRQQQEVTRYINEIAENTFRAILRRDIPVDITNRVYDNILSAKLIRSNSTLTFKLKELPSKAKTNKFVILEITHTYRLRNVSAKPHLDDIKVFSPAGRVKRLDDHLAEPKIEVDSVQLNKAQMEKAKVIDVNIEGVEVRYEHAHIFPPNKEVQIKTSFQLIKERSDAEYWSSFYPSRGIEVNVESLLKEPVKWHVDTLHSGKMEPTLEAATAPPFTDKELSFKPIDVILPYQGIILWWRPVAYEEWFGIDVASNPTKGAAKTPNKRKSTTSNPKSTTNKPKNTAKKPKK